MKKELLVISVGLFLILSAFGVEADTGLTNCGDLSTENEYYYLQNDVSANATCFTVLANNVTLDCQNYAINYNSVSVGHAVSNDNVTQAYNFTTIKNCNINQTGTTSVSYGISLYGVSGAVIDNNTIKTKGTGSYGIYLYNSSNVNITNNNNVSSTQLAVPAVYVDTNSHDVVIQHNTVRGIFLRGNYFDILDNNISSACSVYMISGLYDNINIIGNNFNGGHGIGESGSVHSNINIINNSFTAICGMQNAVPLNYFMSNLVIMGNYIERYNQGIVLTYTTNGIVHDNFLNLTGSQVVGIGMGAVTNVSIDNNTIIANSSTIYTAPIFIYGGNATVNNTHYTGNISSITFQSQLSIENVVIENMVSTDNKTIYVLTATDGNVSLINCSTTANDFVFEASTTIIFNSYKYLDLFIKDNVGTPIGDAHIILMDAFGSPVFDGMTGFDGRIDRQTLLSFTKTEAETVPYTPYMITIDKDGYEPYNAPLDLSETSLDLDIELSRTRLIASMPFAGVLVVVLSMGALVSIIGFTFETNGDPKKYIEAMVGALIIITILTVMLTAT